MEEKFISRPLRSLRTKIEALSNWDASAPIHPNEVGQIMNLIDKNNPYPGYEVHSITGAGIAVIVFKKIENQNQLRDDIIKAIKE